MYFYKRQSNFMKLRVIFVICMFITITRCESHEGYFNGTVLAVLPNNVSLNSLTAFSFKTCDSGELLSVTGSTGDAFSLQLISTGELQIHWTTQGHNDSLLIPHSLLDNTWHNFEMNYVLRSVIIKVDRESVIVANDTWHDQLTKIDLTSPQHNLVLGRGFKGCILEGPNIPVQEINSSVTGFTPGCMMPTSLSCDKIENGACFSQPCLNHGRCVPTGDDSYFCECTQRFKGPRCEIDSGPLCSQTQSTACQNGGICQEDRIGNTTSCTCPVGFSGRFCQMASDDDSQCAPCLNGGTCQPAGEGAPCLCLQGFEGALCETSTNQCLSMPCQHGGVCTHEGNGFSCDCSETGYRGSNCEININECLEQNPCKHGGTCFDRYGDYLCVCLFGMGGNDCSQPVDACALGQCRNEATCLPQPDLGFQCLCQLGFEGSRCEVNIDDCDGVKCPSNSHCVDGANGFSCNCNEGFHGVPPQCHLLDTKEALRSSRLTTVCPPDNTCSGNGRCVVLNNGTNICECFPGFQGNQCESVTVSKCHSSPCQNGGLCKDMDNDYKCECPAGWSGKDCDWNESGCSSNPCMHGHCLDVLHSYSCVCDDGYSGVHCDYKVNFCSAGVCLNGGTCLESGTGFHCDCPPGTMGRICEEIFDACAAAPCKDGGTCVSTPPSQNFTCLCPEGLLGNLCQINIDDCQGVTCPTPQVCHDKTNGYECGCPSGFSGPDCETKVNECRSNPCMNEGTCEEHHGTFLCHCAAGFTGSRCQSDVNECQVNSSVCANGGRCENIHGTYQCFCRPGFTGDHCHIDIDECWSSPCMNLATCLNLINNYVCNCAPGYTGRHCEVDIDECQSNPCQHSGKCLDAIDGYSCQCLPGFTGSNCEVNIDECYSSPCNNGGLCVDEINRYHCNCDDTGFMGVHCEFNIDDCEGRPCENDGTCEDLVKDYSCHCHPGYEGKNCQVDFPDCASSPCQNGAPCLENSNKTLYEVNYLGRFSSFSYSNSSGYICVCPEGFTGINCEINIDDCEFHNCVNGTCVDGINSFTCLCHPGFESLDCSHEINECEKYSPCVNGATCVDKLADYSCQCLPTFGDKNCSTVLLGCTMVQCQNGATCLPFLENNEHKFRCLCPGGYTGNLCNVSTIASFHGGSMLTYTHHIQESSKYDVSFQFRTTLPDGLLLSINEHDLSLVAYLEDGSVNLAIESADLTSGIKETSQNLNDGTWRDVAIHISGNQISLNISNWLREDMLHSDTFQIHSTTFGTGRITPIIERIVGSIPNFIGCMRDIRVGGQLVIPQTSSIKKELEFECQRTEQCFPDTCLNDGLCRDLWHTHKCKCFRPYFGVACENIDSRFKEVGGTRQITSLIRELVKERVKENSYVSVVATPMKPAYDVLGVPAATYGFGQASSWSAFTIPAEDQSSLSDSVKISTFLRSRQPEGLLFYLGPVLVGVGSDSQYDHLASAPTHLTSKMSEMGHGFLSAFLHGGHLKLLAGGNDHHNVELISVGSQLNDGYYHFIEVERNSTYLTLWVNGSLSGQQRVQGGQNSEVLYIGGVPSSKNDQYEPERQVSRRKRQASSTSIDMHSLENVTYFRGIIRDFRLNNRLVPVFPLHLNTTGYSVPSLVPDLFQSPVESSNVSEGELSNNPCRQFNPCDNDGVCVDAWDAYRCKCKPGFRGTNCTEREPCSLYACPEGATCQNLPKGYECVSQASFRGNLSLRYHSHLTTGRLSQHSLSLRFRTQYKGGTLMEVVGQARGGHVQKLWIKAEDSVVVQWTLWPEDLIASLDIVSGVADGEWHSVQVHVNQTTVKAELKTGKHVIERFAEYNSSTVSLMQLLEQGDILLGGPDSTALGNSKFKGCLNEVRVGGLLLPFYGAQLLENDTSPDRFVLDDSFGLMPVPSDCVLCWPEDCLNGGHCAEPSNSSRCECPVEFKGPNCDLDVDECVNISCLNNGTCINSYGGFDCHCQLDYTGKLCESEIDPCESSPCENGATCMKDGKSFRCHCPSSFQGYLCNELVHVDCHSKPCQNNATCVDGPDKFTCHCLRGSYGLLCEHVNDYCQSEYCSGHGTCKNRPLEPERFACMCVVGYSGIQCAEEANPCELNPCQNGGTCKKEGNTRYTCDCPQGWTDQDCVNDVNECLENPCENNSTCSNLPGSYECKCHREWTGKNCNLKSVCYYNVTCHNGGTCIDKVTEEQLVIAECFCLSDFKGSYCEAARESDIDLALIIGLTLGCVCFICILVATIMFLRIAKKKRATRGTYSPSRQEMFGSRVEMNHVMKPPPEERLI